MELIATVTGFKFVMASSAIWAFKNMEEWRRNAFQWHQHAGDFCKMQVN